MSYENMRNALATRLLEKYGKIQVNDILSELDTVANDYDVTAKSLDLIVLGGVPEIVKIYVASKAIENMSAQTLYNYKRHLTNFFSAVCKPVTSVTTNDIRIYLHQYKQTHKITDSSLNLIRSIICAFFKWATNEEYIQRDPAAKVGKIKFQPSERTAMAPIELELLRNACQTLREKALVDFLYSTGCRVFEVSDMLISNVDMESGTAYVLHGKGDKKRPVYLNAECIISLKAYLKSRSDKCQYLFVSDRKPAHKLTTKALENEITKISSRVDIKTHVTPHVFRHLTATTAIQSGMPIEQVQRLLGHANINTTLIYAKTSDEDVKANHRRFVS